MPGRPSRRRCSRRNSRKPRRATSGSRKDGRTLYCKREKLIGSTIPTTQCMTEERLRLQVEYDQQMRDRMRTGARCALGRRGGAGGCAGS